MTINTAESELKDISQRGMRVLLAELGSVDTMRFLHGVYLSIHGRDSVAEKHRSEDGMTAGTTANSQSWRIPGASDGPIPISTP